MWAIYLTILVIILLNKNKENFTVKKSNIHGVGVYTTKYYKKNSFLFEAIESDKEITELGKYINHCDKPNTVLLKYNNGWSLFAIQDIDEDTEILTNYKQAPYFIQPPNKNWTC